MTGVFSCRSARAGQLLDNKSALIWNGYQGFPLEKALPQDDNRTDTRPGQLQNRVEAFLERGRQG